MSITQNIIELKASLPGGVTLIAVSKFHPAKALLEAYEAGQRVFGESRTQELKAKQQELPSDIEWHFIGTLQRNKVKDIAAYVHTIHSVDSTKLLEEIQKEASKNNRNIHILLEIHIAEEETKHGLNPIECKELLSKLPFDAYPNIRFAGLMCMATDTDDTEQVRKEFRLLHSLFVEIKEEWFKNNTDFKQLSMGMSHDYSIAIEEGSTMVRIGTRIFGEREY